MTEPASKPASKPTAQRLTFLGHDGHELAARLDLPAGPVRGYALFAHCFTCSKDIQAARRISQSLAGEGFGVLRFDFTGLGASEGEFSNTDFSSNVRDLLAAADHLRTHLEAPAILIGHSLGGAAVLAAAGDIPEVKAVATIGAPGDVEHVLHNFKTSLETIASAGQATVELGGRTFTINKSFVDDARAQRLAERISNLRRPLLVLHAPRDETVGIDNATQIFTAAKHPKSFVSLDNADHLLSRPADAEYAASVIAAWATRYVGRDRPAAVADAGDSDATPPAASVRETTLSKFQTAAMAGRHRLLVDEPARVGGLDSGPDPYAYLSIALAACTSMTLRMYADRKGLELGPIEVDVSHDKVDAGHCQDCGAAAEGRTGRIDRFERRLRLTGKAAQEQAEKLLEIADKCPVHRTLEASSVITTRMAGKS